MDLTFTLMLLCLGCWTTAYILMIKRGVQDKTFGMPLGALCANLAFEGLFSFYFPVNAAAKYGNMLWFVFSLGIFLTLLRYGREDYSHSVVKQWFYPLVAVVLLLFVWFEFTIVTGYQDNYGQALSLATNLLNASLMIAMLARRGNVRGQSFYIALFLLLGNLPGYYLTIYFKTPSPPPPRVLVAAAYACIWSLNLSYLILVWRQCRREGIHPLRRF